jgi:hypothetical protein
MLKPRAKLWEKCRALAFEPPMGRNRSRAYYFAPSGLTTLRTASPQGFALGFIIAHLWC